LRHLSTGKFYSFMFKFLLGLFGLTQLLFYLSTIVLFVLWIFPWYVLAAFIVRFYSQFLVHKFVLGRLKERNILLFSLVWELFHIIIIHSITFMGIFRKNHTWK